MSDNRDVQNEQCCGSQGPGAKATGRDTTMSTYSIKMTNDQAPRFIIFHR